MGKRGPQPTGQTTEVIRIKKTTRAVIRRLAADLGLSQSEVVDMWRKFWEENHIETAKEDKENVRN